MMQQVNSMVRGKYLHSDEVPEGSGDYFGYEFTDDVSGLELDKQLVKAGRELEIKFF